MELFDILDENEKKIGVAPRSIAHKKGLLHLSIHVIVYNSKSELLIQKRAKEKDFDADKWDFLLGGHATLGNTPQETALKEIKEEYGISVKQSDLEFLGKRRFQLNIAKKYWFDNEINYIYLLKYNGKIKDLILQKEEVSEVKFISLKQLEKDILNPIKRKEYCAHKDYSYYFEMIGVLRKKFGIEK
ncbi:MAG: NUDIX hydrolase [Candidatus Nanoarchaeia archaeon]